MQFTTKQKNELAYCNNCYMLGTLATNSIEYPGVGESNEAITIMRNSQYILFYIKALSDEPRPINEYVNPYTPTSDPLYIGVDTHQNQAILPKEYTQTNDLNKKMDIIKANLQNRIVLFRPHITFKDGKPDPFKNLEIIAIETDVEVDPTKEFICIPKVNMDNKTFEQKLLAGSNLTLEDYNHYMLLPEYILCGDYIYSNFKSWDKYPDNKKIWSCNKEQDKIKRVKLVIDDEKMKNKIIRGTDNLIFAESDYLQKIINAKFDEDGEYIANTIKEATIFAQSTEETNEEEVKFLKDFKQYTIENHLCYATKDLVNFHVSTKTNPLTIVAGMSGTGKTQLARAYGKVLGLSEEDGTLLFLPISPSYTEPEDLLGYLNTTNGLYMAAESGLLDILINAEKNQDKMYMIIFDEMNLSQVEHWFAPFISLLEIEADDRYYKLYSKNSICHNCERYKNSIQIRDNIIFIGTVNLDETTKDFSDRLLDRANIVTLQKQSFVSLKEEQDKVKDKIYISKLYSFDEYSNWIKKRKETSLAFTTEELTWFDKLHDIIQKYDVQKGVSFRIFERIGIYLMNIPTDPQGIYNFSREDAIDIQIKQRLLTKIKGTERQFENLIGTMKSNSDIPSNSELYDFFNSEETQCISHFNFTKKEICRKARELSLYGYAN